MVATVAQAIVNGLLIGGLYALVSIGVTLIFGVVKIVNFAQGEFVTIPAFIALSFLTFAHFPWYLAYLLTMASMVRCGLAFQFAAYYPLRNRTFLPVVISTTLFDGQRRAASAVIRAPSGTLSRPISCATPMLRSIERPISTHARPRRCAELMVLATRCTLEAKVVTMTRPGAH